MSQQKPCDGQKEAMVCKRCEMDFSCGWLSYPYRCLLYPVGPSDPFSSSKISGSEWRCCLKDTRISSFFWTRFVSILLVCFSMYFFLKGSRQPEKTKLRFQEVITKHTPYVPCPTEGKVTKFCVAS
eukprot:g77066.t1